MITQNNRPLGFFSRKLSQAQQKCSMTKQELLAIVETLNDFKGMLWGQTIMVYTDDENLMQAALDLTPDQVNSWTTPRNPLTLCLPIKTQWNPSIHSQPER